MSEWIKVGNRLPFDIKKVTSDFICVPVIEYANGSVVYCRFVGGHLPKDWSRFDIPNVTHWQPLPDDPK